MNKTKYRIYIIILSEISSFENDMRFSEKVIKLKYDWWRYTPLNWILITPDDVSTNHILEITNECYGINLFTCVMEITINDISAVTPKNLIGENGWTPVHFLKRVMHDPTYTPPWVVDRTVNKDKV